MKTDFYKTYRAGWSRKYPKYENLMLHHCCEHCQVKGNLLSRRKLSSNERVLKIKKKTSHHQPQCAKWFSRYSISMSGIWTRSTSPLCRFSASFSIKYDVTDGILQDNEKLKVQYFRSLLFDLFESLQAVRTWQRNFASFQILLLWQSESKLLPIIEKQKVYCLSKSNVLKVI